MISACNQNTNVLRKELYLVVLTTTRHDYQGLNSSIVTSLSICNYLEFTTVFLYILFSCWDISLVVHPPPPPPPPPTHTHTLDTPHPLIVVHPPTPQPPPTTPSHTHTWHPPPPHLIEVYINHVFRKCLSCGIQDLYYNVYLDPQKEHCELLLIVWFVVYIWKFFWSISLTSLSFSQTGHIWI